MSESLGQKKEKLLETLAELPANAEMVLELVRKGPPYKRLDPDFCTEDTRVSGCMANLWIRCAFKQGQCCFACASDSKIVEAVAGLLCGFYSDAEPGEILGLDPSFLREAGLTQHLTANRRNALSNVWKVIRRFAEQHGGPFYDAHNHFHDAVFDPCRDEVAQAVTRRGIVGMVVNGTSEDDWDRVFETASACPSLVRPSVGLHPWFVPSRSDAWFERLEELVKTRACFVGEIGLDRWKKELPYDEQEAVFTRQLALAAKYDRAASIHCLRAWGRMLELLEKGPRPDCGFLLHSYGGPAEMVEAFAELGAYFSFPGYFMRASAVKKHEAFRRVPLERLLVETDAPDQRLPDEQERYPLKDETGQAVNHPANLPEVYEFLAGLRGAAVSELTRNIGANFERLFPASSFTTNPAA